MFSPIASVSSGSHTRRIDMQIVPFKWYSRRYAFLFFRSVILWYSWRFGTAH